MPSVFARFSLTHPNLQTTRRKSKPSAKSVTIPTRQVGTTTSSPKVSLVVCQPLGYVIEVSGQSARLRFPSKEKQSLYLVQPFLVAQVFIEPSSQWSLELELTDAAHTKRWVSFFPSLSCLEKNNFHIKVPSEVAKRGEWLNLCIDILSFMEV